MSNSLTNGEGFDLSIPPGNSLTVVAVSGSYNASIVDGVGKGAALATNGTGGTYGPYTSGAVIRLISSALSEVDYDIGASPVIVSDTHVMAQTNPLTGGGISLLAGAVRLPVAVDVMSFGAVGDGVALDSAAIALAVAAAGINGVIQLQAGKTYLVDRSIQLLRGQTLLGYGATVKRCAQILTTTTSGVTSGSTHQVTVAAGTGANFSAGQTISAFNGVNYGKQNVTIASIDGDVINTVTSFILSAGSPFAGVTTIALSFDTIETDANVEIYGLIIDGSKDNWSKYHWEITSEIHTAGGTNSIIGVEVSNAPGEGIQESGSPYNQYRNNIIRNCNGNGIHLSGSTATQVTGNYIDSTNLEGGTVGHSGGCITVSNSVVDLIVSNNHLSNGRAGVGQIDSSDNSFVSILGNTVKNMSAFMLECRGFNAYITDVLISGNRFHNDVATAAGQLICVGLGDTQTNDCSRFTVTGNSFFNSGLVIERMTDVTVSGNGFACAYQASDTYHNHIIASNVVNATITGNTTHYGNSGIGLGGTNSGVLVSGNGLHNAYYHGIFDVGGTDISITNNNINMDTNVSSSGDGIQTVGPSTVIKNNNIKMLAGYAGIRVNGVPNSVVQGNTVRASGAGKTIRIEAGSTGYVVSENQMNYAVTDTPAVGVRVANNDVIV